MRSGMSRLLLRRGGGDFSPASISNLITWVDFSDVATLFQDNARTSPVTTNGQQIKGVTDKSGTGNHLDSSSATGPAYEVGSINGKSAADYVATTPNWLGRLTLVGGTLAQPGTEVVVVKTDLTPANTQITDAHSGGTNRWSINWNGTTPNWFAGANQVMTGKTVSTTNPQIVVAGYNGASSKAWLDGGAGVTANPDVNPKQGLRLGIENGGASNPFDGRYCEYLLFSRTLTLSEVNQLGSYLASKWGVAAWATAT